MSTLGEVYRKGRRVLAEAKVEGPDFEAGCLFEKVFGLSRQERILHSGDAANSASAEQFYALARERTEGRPLQYLLGEWPFFGRNLLVGEGVLIPREETELLVRTAAGLLDGAERPKILDLCSGSGAVAIALAGLLPGARVDAAEWMEPAYRYLTQNIEKSGCCGLHAIRLDVLDPESARSFSGLDCIVSNPPYVRSGDLPGLQREVQREPREALDGGADGLLFYRAIASLWVPALKDGGKLCVECGENQSGEIAEIFRGAGLSKICFHRDFNGIERVVSGIFRE